MVIGFVFWTGWRFSALQRAEIAEMGRQRVAGARSSHVSVLFNEPKLLKSWRAGNTADGGSGFSALQRAEIAEMSERMSMSAVMTRVSVLFNEPKLLKSTASRLVAAASAVSVLFNEPKLLK